MSIHVLVLCMYIYVKQRKGLFSQSNGLFLLLQIDMIKDD